MKNNSRNHSKDDLRNVTRENSSDDLSNVSKFNLKHCKTYNPKKNTRDNLKDISKMAEEMFKDMLQAMPKR